MHASSGDPKSAAPSSASNTSGPADNNTSAPPSNGGSDYPEQLHAGKVGYGPNYRAGPSLEDKIQGLKEELKGKVTHKPDLVQHGREVMSGEEKRKKLTGEVSTPGGMAVNQGYGKGAMEQAATVAPEGTREAEMQRKGNNIDFAGRPVDVQPRQ
ncbi:hypothetical protein GALMADRAFT_64291 [Galerina marginata CBS 339.88]|uniref:Uncharacterized protein n=1 Tax=Galerina marginata (strain CBS 339.88) TaxID=685588 RepID=A0A067TGF3_GALM3|nr:hypothetical protein GALMADRAFT_64291 [Galerina marginata CBS 339.88]